MSEIVDLSQPKIEAPVRIRSSSPHFHCTFDADVPFLAAVDVASQAYSAAGIAHHIRYSQGENWLVASFTVNIGLTHHYEPLTIRSKAGLDIRSAMVKEITSVEQANIAAGVEAILQIWGGKYRLLDYFTGALKRDLTFAPSGKRHTLSDKIALVAELSDIMPYEHIDALSTVISHEGRRDAMIALAKKLGPVLDRMPRDAVLDRAPTLR